MVPKQDGAETKHAPQQSWGTYGSYSHADLGPGQSLAVPSRPKSSKLAADVTHIFRADPTWCSAGCNMSGHGNSQGLPGLLVSFASLQLLSNLSARLVSDTTSSRKTSRKALRAYCTEIPLATLATPSSYKQLVGTVVCILCRGQRLKCA